MAARQELEILLKMKADLDQGLGQAIAGIRSIDTETKKASANAAASAKKMQDAFAAFGQVLISGAVLGAMNNFLKAQGESEAAINKLNLALANQGRYNEGLSKNLIEYAAALQKTSTYSDETVLGAEAILASFGMNEAQIKRTTQAALDFAAATGTDLETATNLLGKAFAGNTAQLWRYGIVIDQTLPVAQRFEAALGQLEQRFGGQAIAAAQNYEGQLAQLKNAFNDVEESIGKFLGAMLDLGGVGGGAKEALGWLADFFGSKMIIALGEARAQVLEFFAGIADQMAKIGELAGKHSIITRVLGGDPKELASQGQAMKDFASSLRYQIAGIRDESDKAAASVGKILKPVNAPNVARSAQERAQEAESLKIAQEAEKKKELIDKLLYDSKLRAMRDWLKDEDEGEKFRMKMAAQAAEYQIKLDKEEADAAKDRFERRKEYEEAFARIAIELAQQQHEADLRATEDFGRLGQAIQGVGEALGSGFLTNLGSAMDLFAGISIQAQNAANGMQKATVVMNAAGAALNSGSFLSGAGAGAAAGSMFGPIGAGIGALAGGLLGLFGKAKKAREEMKKLQDQFVQSMGGMDALKKAAAAAGVSLDAMFKAKNKDALSKAIDEIKGKLDTFAQANDDLNKAIEKYGFTVQELGPKFAAQKLDEMAAGLLKDYQLLIAAGVDAGTVVGKMAPDLLNYVHTAIAAGQSIPESMKPIIDQLIAQGLLLDENGNAYKSAEDAGVTYAKTLSESMQDAVDAIMKLVAALTGIPQPNPIHIPVSYDNPGAPPGGGDRHNPEFGAGGIVLPFRRAAKGTVVGGPTHVLMGEKGAEVAAPISALFGRLGDTIAQKVGGAGPSQIVVPIHVGGEKLDNILIRRNKAGMWTVKKESVR
jgi:hypothetical protein